MISARLSLKMQLALEEVAKQEKYNLENQWKCLMLNDSVIFDRSSHKNGKVYYNLKSYCDNVFDLFL